MDGTIKRLTDKGFGFIKGEDGKEYFFHKSAVQAASFDGVKIQTAVEFDAEDGLKGPRAENVYLS